jgi:hypothetical protein
VPRSPNRGNVDDSDEAINAALHGNAQRTLSNTQVSNRKDAAETEGINEIQQTESPGMWVARDFLGNPLRPIAPPGLPDDNGGIFFNQRQELEGVTGGGTPLLANTPHSFGNASSQNTWRDPTMSRTNLHSGARANIDFTGSKSHTDYLADQLARNDNPLYGASCNGYNGRSRQIEFIGNPTGIFGKTKTETSRINIS